MLTGIFKMLNNELIHDHFVMKEELLQDIHKTSNTTLNRIWSSEWKRVLRNVSSD